jgi:hypothetical protein
LSACLGPDMRVVNKRYFHLWHNHGGRLNMRIITGHVLCGVLISMNGLISSVLSLNLIFLRSLEKSTWWVRSNCFHCLPSTGCRIFSSVLRFTCQINSSAYLGVENIRFTFLSLEPSMSWSEVTFFLFHPCLFFCAFCWHLLNLLIVIVSFVPTSITPWTPIFEFIFFSV